jgi:hypothetical protein
MRRPVRKSDLLSPSLPLIRSGMCWSGHTLVTLPRQAVPSSGWHLDYFFVGSDLFQKNLFSSQNKPFSLILQKKWEKIGNCL